MTPSTAEHCRRGGPAGPAGWPALAAGLALAWAAAGCSSTGAGAAAQARGGELGRVMAGQSARLPRPLKPYVDADRNEGERNLVLNAMVAGKEALDLGAVAQARAALDLAYQRIETIYADNPAAQQARSKFAPEARKDFKGEAYERAMVGYYLGLADMLMGELDNAKASFKWGEFQDTLSAAEVYQGDMASLRFLAGWVEHCQGKATSARESFRLARELRPELQVPPADANVLLILEAGPAPRKTRSGRHGEELSFVTQARMDGDVQARFSLDGGSITGALAEDVHWQASTLGGRAVDRILAGKAAFKDNATTVAQAGSAVATVGLEVMRLGAVTGDRNTLNLGGYSALAGMLFNMAGSATAAATTPEADIRFWSNLPAGVFMATAAVAPDKLAGLQVSGHAPAQLGGTAAQAGSRPVPGTRCHVARLAAGSSAGSWNQADAGAWIALDELERAPAQASRNTSDPDKPRAPPPKTAPVRATF